MAVVGGWSKSVCPHPEMDKYRYMDFDGDLNKDRDGDKDRIGTWILMTVSIPLKVHYSRLVA